MGCINIIKSVETKIFFFQTTLWRQNIQISASMELLGLVPFGVPKQLKKSLMSHSNSIRSCEHTLNCLELGFFPTQFSPRFDEVNSRCEKTYKSSWKNAFSIEESKITLSFIFSFNCISIALYLFVVNLESAKFYTYLKMALKIDSNYLATLQESVPTYLLIIGLFVIKMPFISSLSTSCTISLPRGEFKTT